MRTAIVRPSRACLISIPALARNRHAKSPADATDGLLDDIAHPADADADAAGTPPSPRNRERVAEPRAAAVLVAISADPPHPVVFVERAAHLRAHPGQIGFPGGTVDAVDGDDRARTALRELHEEIGIPSERVTIVGRLPDAHQRSNTFVVTPLVGVLQADTPLIIDPTETAAVFTVPLDAIVADGAVHRGSETVGERRVETWVFDYGELHVWGLTAGILREFVVAWNAPRSALRHAAEHALGLNA